jgi:hypothetical protein
MMSYYRNDLVKFVGGKIIIVSKSLEMSINFNDNNIKENFKSIINKFCTFNLDITNTTGLRNVLIGLRNFL